MEKLPHHYTADAVGGPDDELKLRSAGLPELPAAAPAEFDGPGDRWSPETMLVAAVASCFVLTFRAIARASKLPWNSIEVSVTGRLDRVEGKTRFTRFDTRATLDVPPGTGESLARRLLEKAEQGCLVSNSLSADRSLETVVRGAG